MYNMSYKHSVLFLSLLSILTSVTSVAETVLHSITAAPQAQVELMGGSWQREQNIDVLKAEIPLGKTQVSLIRITKPAITSRSYILKGRVRGSNISGYGYLELLSTFPDSNTYFSRTLAKKGPQASLSGSFDWRYFSLPFTLNKNGVAPDELVLNFAAAEGAEISLSALQLTEDSANLLNAWFTEQSLGIIGGVFGTLLGLFGAVVGILSSRGKGRNFVIRGIALFIGIGITLIVGGLTALALNQPEYVSISLLISGAFIVLLMTGLRQTLVKRYLEIELRRMHAQDTK